MSETAESGPGCCGWPSETAPNDVYAATYGVDSSRGDMGVNGPLAFSKAGCGPQVALEGSPNELHYMAHRQRRRDDVRETSASLVDGVRR